MIVKKYRGDEERTILTALIVHDKVLGRVAPKAGAKPFRNKWCNVICGWCCDFFKKYNRAPRGSVQHIFTKFAEKSADSESVDLLDQFLSTLSDNYKAQAEEMNEEFLVRLAQDHFAKIALDRTADRIKDAVENGQLDEAKEHYSELKLVDFEPSDWSNPFTKKVAIETLEYFSEDRRLIEMPGDLGKFLSPYLGRDCFVSFTAPEKVGKSFWLQEMVVRGLFARRRVLYYVLGDMSEKQVNRRLYSRLTGAPFETEMVRIPTAIRIVEKRSEREEGEPEGEEEEESKGREPQIKFHEEERVGLTLGKIGEAIRMLKVKTATKQLRLRMRCVGASVLRATDIEEDISMLTQEDWIPDMVVIDYADLLLQELESVEDFRHQTNDTWKILRRISTDWNCLVLTATQASAKAYKSKLIRKEHFSEDKRKNAHVTGMIGINQTQSEKDLGIYRLNWPFLRDGRFNAERVLYCAGELGIKCPVIKSTF